MSHLRTLVLIGVVLACSAAAWAQATASAPVKLEGDYWVEPMKLAHAKFNGQRGVVAQFGDSITITMAFFVPLKGEIKNLPEDLKPAHAWLNGYVQNRCWANWKDPAYGNEGRTTTEWGLSNMDGWLKKMNPEVALIMWGTNDSYLGPHPPKYTDNLRAIIQKNLDNGTVPILFTIPPVGSQAGNEKKTKTMETFVEAARTVAAEKKIPLLDFYKEILDRQPENFAKTLMGDDLHPSYPQQYQNDFSAEGLKNSGYTLRNYLTLVKMYEVQQKVLSKVESARTVVASSTFKGQLFRGRPAISVVKVDAAPVIDGKLDDAVWQKAAALEFRMLDGDVKKPTESTEARVLSTDKALYVAFKCNESEMDTLVSSKRSKDGDVWADDSVEVFLLPAPKAGPDYYQLIINPDGSCYDALAKDKAAWTSSVKIATGKGKDFWAVEIELPFADLKLPTGKAAQEPWRVNLNRNRPARSGYVEDTALAPTESTSSHEPEMFAYAFLEALGAKMPEATSQK